MSVRSKKPKITLDSGAVRWTKNLKIKMADFIRENYNSYKVLPRMTFARNMKAELQFDCTDIQLKNGLCNLIKNYMDIKAKLNSSGFGVDAGKDKTLNTGWILKKCPYFEILDEVMSSRPNVSPPIILQSNAAATESENTDLDEVEPDPTKTSDSEFDDVEVQEANYDSAETQKKKEEISTVIKDSFKGIGVLQKRDNPPKNALQAFAKTLEDKAKRENDVELVKHELEVKKFKYSREHNLSSLEVEKMKIEVEREISLKKIESEKEMKSLELSSKKEDQEFKLKKLKLLIQLEEAKKSSANS